jgi:hypothetical protein
MLSHRLNEERVRPALVKARVEWLEELRRPRARSSGGRGSMLGWSRWWMPTSGCRSWRVLNGRPKRRRRVEIPGGEAGCCGIRSAWAPGEAETGIGSWRLMRLSAFP